MTEAIASVRLKAATVLKSSYLLYVLTFALIIASGKSGFTVTKEASHSVGTVCIATALGQVYFTLVHI